MAKRACHLLTKLAAQFLSPPALATTTGDQTSGPGLAVHAQASSPSACHPDLSHGDSSCLVKRPATPGSSTPHSLWPSPQSLLSPHIGSHPFVTFSLTPLCCFPHKIGSNSRSLKLLFVFLTCLLSLRTTPALVEPCLHSKCLSSQWTLVHLRRCCCLTVSALPWCSQCPTRSRPCSHCTVYTSPQRFSAPAAQGLPTTTVWSDPLSTPPQSRLSGSASYPPLRSPLLVSSVPALRMCWTPGISGEQNIPDRTSVGSFPNRSRPFLPPPSPRLDCSPLCGGLEQAFYTILLARFF